MNAAFTTETLSNGISIRVLRAKARRPISLSVRLETPRSAARDAALVYAESRLAPWAKWAKEYREQLGCPTISLLYKAMRMSKVGVIHGRAYPVADDHGIVHYPINADGRATRSFRPPQIGEVPPAIMEVDEAVAVVPAKPREVLIADYFVYGPIEERCKRTPHRRTRYLELLESAKYSVYVALMSRAEL